MGEKNCTGKVSRYLSSSPLRSVVSTPVVGDTANAGRGSTGRMLALEK